MVLMAISQPVQGQTWLCAKDPLSRTVSGTVGEGLDRSGGLEDNVLHLFHRLWL